MAVGTVWRQASWLGAAQTPAPKNSKPIANSPIATKAKELEQRPEFIEGRRPGFIEVKALRPSKGFISLSLQMLVENEFYTPVGGKAQIKLKDVPLHRARFWLSSQ